MKKLFHLLLFGAILYGGYQAGLDYASDKLVDEVTAHMGNGALTVQGIYKIPEVEDILWKYKVTNLQEIDRRMLVYHSKEEVLKGVVSKMEMSEAKDIVSKMQYGFTSEDKTKVLDVLYTKLSKEELESVKIIALQELIKRQKAETL